MAQLTEDVLQEIQGDTGLSVSLGGGALAVAGSYVALNFSYTTGRLRRPSRSTSSLAMGDPGLEPGTSSLLGVRTA
jgi:hypothetical protein